MGSFSNQLEDEMLDHVFSGTYTAPDTYIGLSTADILDDASGNSEPGGGSYARKQVLAAAWNNASSRAITNNGQVEFVTATASWGTITHWGIWNHLSDTAEANLLAHGSLSQSQAVENGNTVKIPDEDITISFNPSGSSDYLANIFLDYVFKDEAFATPNATIHVALLTTKPTDAGTGSTITEPWVIPGHQSMKNYRRQEFVDWKAATGGLVENNTAINFKNPSASWGEVTHTCSVDASGAGNMLYYGRVGVAQTPDQGSTVEFAADAYDITVT